MRRLILPALVLGLSVSGCYQLQLYSTADAPVQFNHPQRQSAPIKVVRHFYREVQLDYVFGYAEQENGLVNRLLQEEAGPHQIQNLQIRRSYNALDMVVSLLTLGIYTRSWLILEGDVLIWED
ncbi:MAG: hypothetical protein IGS03_01425 [Candidatus Sericytochromatia bacterium]|nr:hypothetical protein [Candidatus Sericytochromatia bacterium]